MWAAMKAKWSAFTSSFRSRGESSQVSGWRNTVITVLGFVVILIVLVGFYWSSEPAPFDVRVNASEKLAVSGQSNVVGGAGSELQ